MIIDINGYFGTWPYWPIKLCTPEQLRGILDRYAIDRVAIMSLRGAFSKCGEGDVETLTLMEALPDRVVGVATASPAEGSAMLDDLDRCHAGGMRALKLLPQHRLFRLDDDPVLDAIIGRAGAWGWPVIIPIRIMTNWGVPIHNIAEIDSLAARHRAVSFIIGGVNWPDVRDALGILRRRPNTFIETSCLQVLGGVEALVSAVGAERVLMGTGLTLQYVSPGLAHVTHAEISDSDKERILGGNAARLLKL